MIKKQLRKSFFARFITLLVLALMSTANLQGETVSIDFSAQGYTNAQAIESAVIAEGINVTFDKGTNSNSVAPKYYTSGNAVRCYGGNYFVVSSSVGDIKEITLTFVSSDGSNEISADCGVFAGSIWTGTANAVKFTIDGDSGHRGILGISVTYELSMNPSINASDITIEADATSGAIDYTIKNPVEGRQLTANSDAPWITDVTVTDTQVTFTTAKNETSAERTANVYLNYEGAKEKTVTVTQKKAIPTYASLAELVAAGEPAGEMVRVTLTDEVIKSITISGDYRTGIIIQVGERDVTIYCYGVPESWIAGGTVSGTLTCVWARLNDALWELCPDDWNDLNYTDPVGAHNVNISENIEHGTVKANPKRGIEGAQITLTATPDEGYKFGSYTVKDAAENNITVTDGKFIMPASDVTVSATFVEKPQYKVTYMSLGANCGEETVLEGDCIADAPTVNTPDGWMWQFAGWTTDASYADDTTAPEFFAPTTPITANITLYAVFSKIIRVSGEYFWNLVTDASTLNSGDVIRLAATVSGSTTQKNNGTFAASYFGDNSFFTSVPATIDVEGKLTAAEAIDIKLGGNATDGWTLTTTEGMIGTKEVKKLLRDNTDEGTVNEWSIEIDSKTSAATITAAKKGRILYNREEPRFLNYTSSTYDYMVLPFIFRKEADVIKSYSIVPTYTREGLTVGNLGTICLPYATTSTSGAKFYSIAGRNMEGGNLATVKSISLNAVEGQLEAGVAYIFQATDETLTANYSGNYVSYPVRAEDNNGLGGVFADYDLNWSETSKHYYVVSGNNIYFVNSDVKVPAFRAYIDMGRVPENTGAKADIEIINGDMPTSIDGVNVEIAPAAVNYNIAGQKVNKNYNGVVISNGKKYIVK